MLKVDTYLKINKCLPTYCKYRTYQNREFLERLKNIVTGGRGGELKLEESESMLDRELSRESLKLDQHLFFTNLNLSRNLATRKLNSVTDLSSSMLASALSAIRFV